MQDLLNGYCLDMQTRQPCIKGVNLQGFRIKMLEWQTLVGYYCFCYCLLAVPSCVEAVTTNGRGAPPEAG